MLKRVTIGLCPKHERVLVFRAPPKKDLLEVLTDWIDGTRFLLSSAGLAQRTLAEHKRNRCHARSVRTETEGDFT